MNEEKLHYACILRKTHRWIMKEDLKGNRLFKINFFLYKNALTQVYLLRENYVLMCK